MYSNWWCSDMKSGQEGCVSSSSKINIYSLFKGFIAFSMGKQLARILYFFPPSLSLMKACH